MTRIPDVDEITRNIDQITFTEVRESRERRYKGAKATAAPRPFRFKKIIVAYDGSEGARDALAWSEWIAHAHGAKIVLALILPPTPAVWSGELTKVSEDTRETINAILDDDEVFGSNMLRAAEDELAAGGLTCETVLARGSPSDEIIALARVHDADLIAMGSHERRTMDRVLLGSVSSAVKQRTDRNVLIARNTPPAQSILLGVDGSRHSRRAAAVLSGLMNASPARAHVVHVMPVPFVGFSGEARDLMKNVVAELHDRAEKRIGSNENIEYNLLYGKPAQRILDMAEEENIGLIVMGARGLSRFKGTFLGSVSNQVVQRAHTSVLVVRDIGQDPAE